MITEQQIAHFNVFGFVFLRKIFTPEEMKTVTTAADELWAAEAGGQFDLNQYQHVNGFVERHPTLTNLVEDDRLYEPISQLLGPGFIWCGSEGNKGSFNDAGVHGWHCDRPREKDLDYLRIKIMIYLQPTSKDTGALRVIPGSHHRQFYDDLDPLNRLQTNLAATPFGVLGKDLPGFPLETEPGDAVLFNQHLYHAVYGKQIGRRYIALKYAAKPVTDSHIEVLKPHLALNIHDTFLKSDQPRIQAMVAPIVALKNAS